MKTFKQYIKSHMCDLSSLKESLLDDEDELSDPLNEIREFLDRIYDCDKPFEIDASGDVVLVNTKGEVRISPKVADLSELTNGMFEFGETGSFVIWGNVKTLKGAPKHVHGSFNVCSYELKSLEGGPIKDDKSYLCSECILLENLKLLRRALKTFSKGILTSQCQTRPTILTQTKQGRLRSMKNSQQASW